MTSGTISRTKTIPQIWNCFLIVLVSKMNKNTHSLFYFCLFCIKEKFKVQKKASLSSFIKMVCALFCAKGPYFFRQNIQFTAYNNDVKFAHNLFCSLDISQKYILYPSFTMCNHFHALLLQFIDTVRVCFNKFDQIYEK